MEILEMIAEWRKGCTLAPHNPAECASCTVALITAIENKEKLKLQAQIEAQKEEEYRVC